MKLVFGGRAREVPLLSTKPVFGHTLGASSSVNLAAAVLMLAESFVIPTINIDEDRQKRGVFHQPNRGDARPLRLGLSMSYGMGGHNAAVLLRRPT
jgi:3-oxoacyl-[acyl-carrier-protein] synthase II